MQIYVFAKIREGVFLSIVVFFYKKKGGPRVSKAIKSDFAVSGTEPGAKRERNSVDFELAALSIAFYARSGFSIALKASWEPSGVLLELIFGALVQKWCHFASCFTSPFQRLQGRRGK